jgi:hypothetical protein
MALPQIKINDVDLHDPAKGQFILNRPTFVHAPGEYSATVEVQLQAADRATLISNWNTFKNTYTTQNQKIEIFLDSALGAWEIVEVGGTLSTNRVVLATLTTVEFDDARATDTSMVAVVTIEASLALTVTSPTGQEGPVTIEVQWDEAGFSTRTLQASYVRTGATSASANYGAARTGLLTLIDVGPGQPLTNETVLQTRDIPDQLQVTLISSGNPNLFTRAGKTDETLTITVDPVDEWPDDPAAGPRPSIASFNMSITADRSFFTDPLSTGLEGFLVTIREQIVRESNESEMELLSVDYSVDPNSTTLTIIGQYVLANTVTMVYDRSETEVETPQYYTFRDFAGKDDTQERPGPPAKDRIVSITRKGVGIVALEPSNLPLNQQTVLFNANDLNNRPTQWLVVGIERSLSLPVANRWSNNIRTQAVHYRLEAVNYAAGGTVRPVTGGMR